MANFGLTLGAIARTVRGTLLGHDDVVVDCVVTDSRAKSINGLFVALKGDRFDGHDFASMAVDNGAVAVLVEKQIDGLVAPHIVVADTLVAMQTLAQSRRQGFNGPVVAITGSSGKTTTRKMVHGILSELYPTLQPIRNFNNHIGVPLTLLEIGDSHGAAVLEIGCSDFGEIGPLTELADPDVALVTNVGPAHLEKLLSLDGVARAKGEMFLAMGKETIAVVNQDDERVAAMPFVSERIVSYGSKAPVDVRLVSRTPKGVDGQQVVIEYDSEQFSIDLKLIGGHNAANALAASAMAIALNVPSSAIASGLNKLNPEPGRLDIGEGAAGLTVIDDTYNANPASMRAALMTLKETGADCGTTAVLGDMLELGEASFKAHEEIGALAAELGIDRLITVGENGRLINQTAAKLGMTSASRLHAANHDEAANQVLKWASQSRTVLVKGSRGMGMEAVVKGLKKEPV